MLSDRIENETFDLSEYESILSALLKRRVRVVYLGQVWRNQVPPQFTLRVPTMRNGGSLGPPPTAEVVMGEYEFHRGDRTFLVGERGDTVYLIHVKEVNDESSA